MEPGGSPVLASPWRLPAPDVVIALGTDPVRGLSGAQAARRLAELGPNEIVERRTRPAWRIFAAQFLNTMILVLLAAAAVTVVIGDLQDTAVILAIVVLNGMIGFVQEYRADRAVAALRALTEPHATVVRDGTQREIAVGDLVPGDLVVLAAGDAVGADARLIDARALQLDESTLTGESEPVTKTTEPIVEAGDVPIADRQNMIFRGTVVTAGRGVGVVVATGMATELGRIAELVQGSDEVVTPLQLRLAALARRLAAAAIVVAVLVFGLGIARGEPLELMLLTAISLAVAAIPEGLPAVVTVALALGARRMARHNALARRLPAVETLGSVSVICSDKTGTLTQNRMLVERVWTPVAEYVATGVGYRPDGTLERVSGSGDDGYLARLASVAAACNDATLIPAGNGEADWAITGDPTEAALLVLARKAGVERDRLLADCPRVAEVGFSPERRRMTTIHASREGAWVATKGALDALAPLADQTSSADWDRAREVAERFADDGFRVLALADRELPAVPTDGESVEHDLRLAGIAAIADPPRDDVVPAIEACRTAGVTPVMITGDHPATALAIARRIGLLPDVLEARVTTGRELDEMGEETLRESVADLGVYARIEPAQKLRIVDAWREQGAVVAMTGDGVNDAPALRSADIGVAMGRGGTEVSKQAADMVLVDDNFATIVSAVREGRRIYDNIRRVVRYLLTTNSAEVWVMVLAPLLGLPLPLLPVQILFINLVTDGLPAIALGVEPAEPDVMERPPRPREESILARGLWQQALWVGLAMAVVTLGVQALGVANGWPWGTMVFTTLAFLQLGNALAVRSERALFIRLGWRTNQALLIAVVGGVLLQLAIVYVAPFQAWFGAQPLDATQLAVVVVASSAGFLLVEAEKWISARFRRAEHRAGLVI
jgi:Ca2+-transporting ATPase